MPSRGLSGIAQSPLQECNLAHMIEIVLCYANELSIGRVGRLGDQWLLQTLFRKALYCLSECFVQLFQPA